MLCVYVFPLWTELWLRLADFSRNKTGPAMTGSVSALLAWKCPEVRSFHNNFYSVSRNSGQEIM